MTWEFCIPDFTPYRLNQIIRHWKAGMRMKRVTMDFLTYYGRDVPKAEKPRRVKLIVTLAPKQRTPDSDSYQKCFGDALKRVGLLRDDSPTWMIGAIEVEHRRGERRSTTVILEEGE